MLTEERSYQPGIFRLYLFTVRYISAIKRIPGARRGFGAKEQCLKEHEKLPKEAGKTSTSVPDGGNLWRTPG